MKTGYIFGAAAMLFAAACCFAQTPASGQKNPTGEGHGTAIVTVMPAHGNGSEQNVQVPQQDVQEIKIDGKPSEMTGWTPLANQPLELVLLIDTSAGLNLGTQMSEIADFVKELPPNTKMGIAFMQNGTAQFAGPLSSDPSQILKGLHLPSGTPGENGSPYFSLSDLARHWPSQDRRARREVLMITDGIDEYYVRYDPDDPYVQAAIADSVRAGLVVYSIYWKDQTRLDRFGWSQAAGQNLLDEVAQDTGGNNYWQGFGNPIDFQPYLKNLRQRLNNQYELRFAAPIGNKGGVEHLNLKMVIPNAKIDAPQEVFVEPVTESER